MGLENFTIEEFIENYTPKIVSLYERPYDDGIYQTVAEDLTTGGSLTSSLPTTTAFGLAVRMAVTFLPTIGIATITIN